MISTSEDWDDFHDSHHLSTSFWCYTGRWWITTSWLWSISTWGKSKKEKKTDLSTIGCFSLLLVCFLFNRMGDLGGEKTFVDVDDVVDDVVDSIWLEVSSIFDVVWLFPNVSLKSGNDECWSRLICDERLLWYNVSSSLSMTISLKKENFEYNRTLLIKAEHRNKKQRWQITEQ